jgi:membrane protease YdiL (CAAX protease family)
LFKGEFHHMDELRAAETSPAVSQVFEAAPVEAPPLSGPSGVGWGFLIYLVLTVVMLTVLSLAVRFLMPHSTASLWRQAASEVATAFSVVVAALIMARIEHRPFASYGLPPRHAFGRLFWIGALWGIVACSALMLSMRAVGVYHFGGFAIGGVRILKFAIFWAVFFTFVGFFEDFLFRGYTQFTLSRGLGFWPTALMLSTAFGAVHLGNSGESKIGALGAALIGLFFCLTLERTGSLWFAVGMHMSWDWGETFFYSVPDSGMVAPGHLFNSAIAGPDWLTGGSVGPEASIFVFIVMALMAVIFHFVYRPIKRVEPGLAPAFESTRVVPYQE